MGVSVEQGRFRAHVLASGTKSSLFFLDDRDIELFEERHWLLQLVAGTERVHLPAEVVDGARRVQHLVQTLAAERQVGRERCA